MDYLQAIEDMLYSQTFRSILWLFARTIISTAFKDEAEAIRKAGFDKEFIASQEVFWDSQIRDYSALFAGEPVRPLEGHIRQASRMVAYNLHVRLNQETILFPTVQRKKNVSQETAFLASPHTDVPMGRITTKDLEVIYAETGLKIGGECELRSAWRFNDLKPRLYYCQGGRDYFSSRYMKRFAVHLMESIPICQRRRRMNPEYFLEHDHTEDYVVTWDYESFTTTLSELKYFLYYIAEALEDLPCYDLRLFDYREGLVTRSPVEMLRDYNEECNIQSPFSIHRLVGRHAIEGDIFRTYRQQNSGMLGVAGNIGFSTANHGYVIQETVGPDNGVCVGDDAKGITRDPDTLVHTISEIGRIHPEKFTVVPPEEEDPYRFLKRGFYRQPNGSFFKDCLYNFPMPPMIDENIGDRDLRYDGSSMYFVKRVCTSAGTLLWELQNPEHQILDQELDVVQQYLSLAYRYHGLPRRGFLPGYRFEKGAHKGQRASFACPSLRFDQFDPRVGDWLEYLLHEGSRQQFDVPILGYRSTIECPLEGTVTYGVQSLLWSALEDLGYVTLRYLTETKDYLEEWDRDAFRRLIKRSLKLSDMYPMYEITCIRTIPERFDSFFTVPYFCSTLVELSREI